MTEADIEKRRRKLTRTYELTAQRRQHGLGYESAGRIGSLVQRLKLSFEEQFLSHYFGRPPKWRMFKRRFKGKRTLPDFCVIGPFKSGSSDLAVNLCLHPAIMIPLAKEFPNPNPESWRKFFPPRRRRFDTLLSSEPRCRHSWLHICTAWNGLSEWRRLCRMPKLS